MKKRTQIVGLSGVFPIPIYTKPFNCGGECIYCPSINGLPTSYLWNSDTQRASRFNFSPSKQLDYYLNSYNNENLHNFPFELIVLGGSFSSLPHRYRINYIKEAYDFLSNDNTHFKQGFDFRNSPYKCSVLTVESRPDQITQPECDFLRMLGVTKVELGLQHLDDSVLFLNRRGHTLSDAIRATKLLKENGFKVGYHIMIGLPGSNMKSDIDMVSTGLWHSNLNPDYLKVYPCTLLQKKELQPKLHKMFKKGNWVPLNTKKIITILHHLKTHTPQHVRISRIQRQFEPDDIFKGPKYGLRNRLDSKCQCIRCREIGRCHPGFEFYDNLGLAINKSTAGKDTYYQVITMDNKLLAIARVYTNSHGELMLREIRVFGRANKIGHEGFVQGKKIGTTLLKHVEKEALAEKKQTILINSSVGAMSFFNKNGYTLLKNNFHRKNL